MDDSDTIDQLMTKKVVTVETSDPMKKALQLMMERDIGNVIVTEKGKPVGILTERDAIRKCVQGKDILGANAGDLMSSPLKTAPPKTKAFEALEIMHKNKIRRLPIVENGKLLGIVTEKDLIYWVIRIGYAPYPPPY
jgi:CBS domain-containing protein